MPNNKILVCTSANNRFATGAAVLLHSLKKNFSEYSSCDFKIFYLELSEENKKMIREITPEVIFEKPADFSYCEGIKTLYGTDNQETYLCIESFKQEQYDKVLWIDSDMLCLEDFANILTHDYPILACLTKSVDFNTNERYMKTGVAKFNAGFMVINRPHLEKGKTYKELTGIIRKAKRENQSGSYKVLHKTSNTFNDQDAIRIYWTNKPVYILSDWHNFKKFGTLGKFPEQDRFFRNNIHKVKIVHYAGKRKPWANKTDRTLVTEDGVMPGKYDVCSVSDPKQLNKCKAVHVWHDYYEECFGEKCVTDWYEHDKQRSW
jgi:lipopolysaccharide biosynthesis glycosyltransferase